MSDQPTETKTGVEEAAPVAERRAGGMKNGYYWGTGRRKTAVARVRLKPGDGKFIINGKEIGGFFFSPRDRADIVAPLKTTKTFGKYDVFANVRGGGGTGQAGAVMLGVARALLQLNPEFNPTLRSGGFLTRDPREVERKKPGRPGARKRFQFSKR